MDIYQIFVPILIIAASALCVALIIYIGKIVKSIEKMQADIQNLSASLKPLIESSLELTENLSNVTEEAQNQLLVSKSIVNDFRERADKLLSIETKVRGGIEEAVMPLIKNLSAIGKGFDTFWRNYKNKQ